MAYFTQIQGIANAVSVSQDTLTLTLPATVGVGNHVMGIVGVDGNGSTTLTSVTDDKSNTYQTIFVNDATNTRATVFFYALRLTNSPKTITVTFGPTGTIAFESGAAEEYSSLGPVDVGPGSHQTQTSTTAPSAPAITAQPHSLIFGATACRVNSVANISGGTGFTLRQVVNNGTTSFNNAGVEDKLDAGGSQTVAFAAAANTNIWCTFAQAFSPSYTPKRKPKKTSRLRSFLRRRKIGGALPQNLPAPPAFIPNRTPRRPKPPPQRPRQRRRLNIAAWVNPPPWTWLSRRKPKKPATHLLLRRRRTKVASWFQAVVAAIPWGPKPKRHKLVTRLSLPRRVKHKVAPWLNPPPWIWSPKPKRHKPVTRLSLRKRRTKLASWLRYDLWVPRRKPKKPATHLLLRRRRTKVASWFQAVVANTTWFPRSKKRPAKVYRPIRTHKRSRVAAWLQAVVANTVWFPRPKRAKPHYRVRTFKRRRKIASWLRFTLWLPKKHKKLVTARPKKLVRARKKIAAWFRPIATVTTWITKHRHRHTKRPPHGAHRPRKLSAALVPTVAPPLPPTIYALLEIVVTPRTGLPWKVDIYQTPIDADQVPTTPVPYGVPTIFSDPLAVAPGASRQVLTAPQVFRPIALLVPSDPSITFQMYYLPRLASNLGLRGNYLYANSALTAPSGYRCYVVASGPVKFIGVTSQPIS